MIIDGKKLAEEVLAELKKAIRKPPPLTAGAVLVGKNPASESFLKQKSKVAEILGIDFEIFKFNSKILTKNLQGEILKLNNNKNINGIIVQLPLPKHIDTKKILNAISPKKDIDALSAKPLVLAPTVEAVKYIFEKYRISLKNKNILIVGRGRLVGQPIYNWLSSRTSDRQLMKINILDIKQKNQLPKLARQADIIISGVGNSGLMNGSMVKKNSILIDFGFSRENGRIGGDFRLESCAKKAKLITPVPGGMGPIMVAMLFKNLFKLSKM